ncbi:hypothetical protein AQUCO_00800131v1 [Aquilegia coerulea]|uniref:Uncharacterized protein n=1 Tax=Aquilegia coerulea TaxID=218851 RepID=A0A2G5EHE2_AQUCA|nr:hypothetical protein AQUCO_00800131v1 [Aquilegia coerulea]
MTTIRRDYTRRLDCLQPVLSIRRPNTFLATNSLPRKTLTVETNSVKHHMTSSSRLQEHRPEIILFGGSIGAAGS